jgi:hypothetical protein
MCWKCDQFVERKRDPNWTYRKLRTRVLRLGNVVSPELRPVYRGSK